MERRILTLVFLFMMCLTPISSKPLKLLARGTFQHGRMRMPVATRVSADYESGLMAINVQNYSGLAQINIYDADGMPVYSSNYTVTGTSTLTLSTENLDEGEYTITISLDNIVYSGDFEV